MSLRSAKSNLKNPWSWPQGGQHFATNRSSIYDGRRKSYNL